MNVFHTVRQTVFKGTSWISLLMNKTFRYAYFGHSWNIEVLPNGTFLSCKTKKLQLNVVIPPCLIHRFFPYEENTETQKNSLMKFFGTVRHKNIAGRSCYPPLNLFPKLLFLDHTFHETQKGCLRSLSFLWDTNFSTKRGCSSPTSYAWKLSITEIFEAPNISALWRKTIPTENSHILFLCIKFFTTRIFLKQRGVTQKNFCVLWDKNLETKVVITPLLQKYINQCWNWCL